MSNITIDTGFDSGSIEVMTVHQASAMLRLKNDYQYLRGTEFMGKAVIMGATSLYLDFVNMFMFLLNFLGSRE